MATSVGTVWVDVRFDPQQVARDLRAGLSGVGAQVGTSIGAGLGQGEQAVASLSQRLTTLGTSMGNVGRQVSLGLSVPLIAFGKAASQSFVEFDTAMTQINTLSGVSAKTVQDWEDDVMSLGGTYGVAADEAAQGLYYITSSGVDAADALEVLDVAAKSSALGLGTTKVAADVVTSAMNQYGKENITAAGAADILTVAVREGKGEADEMAGALARVIPLAGSMGVEFGEVSGIMSAMTLSGTSADEAATQINALLTALQKMPQSAQRNMKALTGLDYATVQAQLKTEGLTQTLRTIYTAFGENEDAIGKVFGNVRALRGITNLFGEKEEQTLAVVNQTTNAMGAQAKAVEGLNNSKAFQLAQARASFKNALTDIGGAVTPIVTKVTEGFSTAFTALNALGPGVQTAVVAFGAFAAAAGPILYVSASTMRLAGTIGEIAMKSDLLQTAALKFMYLRDAINAAAAAGAGWGRAAQWMIQNFGLIAAAAAAAYVSIKLTQAAIYKNQEEFQKLAEQGKQNVAKKNYQELGQTINNVNSEIARNNEEMAAINAELASEGIFQQFDVGAVQRLNDAKEANVALTAVGEAAAKARGQAESLADRFGISIDAALNWINTQKAAGTEYGNATDAINGYTKAVDRHDQSVRTAYVDTEKAKNSVAGLVAATQETSDAFFGVLNAQKAYEASQKAIVDAKQKVIDAEKAHKDAIKGVVTAQRAVADADRKVIESGERLADARQRAADAQQALNDALAGPSKGEQLDLREAQLAVREAQEGMKPKPGEKMTSIERERAQIALERAKLNLIEAQKAHDQRVTDARKDLKDATNSVTDAERAREDAIRAAAESREALQVARDKERETLTQIGDAQKGVTQAQQDAVKPAMDLTKAQSDLNTMFATGTIEGEKFKQYLDRLKGMYPELTTELQKYIDKFNTFATAPEAQPTMPAYPVMEQAYRARFKNVLRPGAQLDPKIVEDWWRREGSKQRARGGFLGAGQISTVNELGAPELFTTGGKTYLLPVQPGMVTPVTESPRQGPQLNISDINVYGADSPVQTAYEVRRQIRSKTDLVGRR